MSGHTLPPKEALILDLLVHAGELYGLELVARSRKQLKRGTVYVTLGRMEAKGLIASRLEARPAKEGGMPRRVYEPTAGGRRVFAAWTEMARAAKTLAVASVRGAQARAEFAR